MAASERIIFCKLSSILIQFLVDMNRLCGIYIMTVIPGGFVISWPLRVADYYNYEEEIRFPEKTLYFVLQHIGTSQQFIIWQIISMCNLGKQSFKKRREFYEIVS